MEIYYKDDCTYWLHEYLKRGVLKKGKKEPYLHIKKADHNLVFANWIVDKHKTEIVELFGDETFYDWVISMFYYAIYHAAGAILSSEGYLSRSHAATLCYLIQNHYHAKRTFDKDDLHLIAVSFEREDIEILGVAKEVRERASYDVHSSFERTLAELTKENAVRFISKVKGSIMMN